MTNTIYNFGAGPAKLPLPVIEQIKDEFLNFKKMGSSIIEISHRSKEFDDLLCETDELFKEAVSLPENYRILYVHGGAQMQFSAIPLNLIHLKPAKKALYYVSGNFANVAYKEAQKFGDIKMVASSSDTNFDRVPSFDSAATEHRRLPWCRWHVRQHPGSTPPQSRCSAAPQQASRSV